MHEQALIRDVIRRVVELAETQRATRVTGVVVRLGALSHFTPGHFREHFADAAQGTIADGATVHTVAEQDLTDPRAGDVVVESVEVEV